MLPRSPQSLLDLPQLRIPKSSRQNDWFPLQGRIFDRLLKPLGHTETHVVKTLRDWKIRGIRYSASANPLAMYLRLLLPGLAVELSGGTLLQIGPPGTTLRVTVSPPDGVRQFIRLFHEPHSSYARVLELDHKLTLAQQIPLADQWLRTMREELELARLEKREERRVRRRSSRSSEAQDE